MTVTELTSAPSLAPLFAKAAVTSALHRGGTLPDRTLVLEGQSIDPARLAAYDRVCGLRYGDVLPATYLHLLAFPLSVRLMTEWDFPFPLIGLVHVANSITVHRPARVDEKFDVTVATADLRPHPAGTQFDVVASAAVAGATVWSSRSTYLRRGKAEGEGEKKQAGELEPQRGTVSQVRVTPDVARRYAAVSGDRNPIHVSGLGAKAFGFPSAIAHGMWLQARTLANLEGRLPQSYRVGVAFKTPVLLPSVITIATEATQDGWGLDVRSAKSGKPHLAGTVSPLP